MKIKIPNCIAGKPVKEGISQAFMMIGGSAMHLDDDLRHQEGFHCVYNHHEQTCVMVAEAHTRIHNRITALYITTSLGETNAVTGVVGGWLDSIPVLVLSGQVRYDTTARWSGVDIRAIGGQEFNIYKVIDCMTKYSGMVVDPMRIRYCLRKALYLARSERPGSYWLDIPLNVQGAFVETEKPPGFDTANYEAGGNGWTGKDGGYGTPRSEAGKEECRQVLSGKVDVSAVWIIINRIRTVKRPVISTGNGTHIMGVHGLSVDVAGKLDVLVITDWDSEDAICDTHLLHVGHAGNMGDRPGNFAIQNSDLVFSTGGRLGIRQVGYNFKTWARETYVAINDVDEEELKKPSVHNSMRIRADIKDLLE